MSAYVYYNVQSSRLLTEMPLSVKMLLISKLFRENIWWVRKMFVPLHSLLRNTLSLSNIKKEFFERFYINRQVVQEAVKLLTSSRLD